MQRSNSDEQLAPVGRGVSLCYQTFGSPDDEPLLLIMGLGGPMTWWNADLCSLLAEAGFYVIRFDNRDIGRSTPGTGAVTLPMLAKAYAGRKVRAPYSIADMADDSFGLLDHLGIDSAHICGVSMGGMIAQTMAIARPERVQSLTSSMSSTGQRRVGFQHPSLLPLFLAKKPGRAGYVRSAMRMADAIGSPGYPPDHDDVRSRAETTYDRGVEPAGVARQMLAILTQPDRTPELRRLSIPTTVIHGLADKMVHTSGGRATAAAVPGAELLLVPGMGHDIPVELWPTYVRVLRHQVARVALLRA